MNRRIAAIVLVTMSLSGLPAYAADVKENAAPTTASAAGEAVAAAKSDEARLEAARWVAAHRRPGALPGLYASFAALQVFDVYSTRRALAGGAYEANPMMKGVVGSPAMFWTVKLASTAAPMLAAEQLWKTNRIAAIALMVASNGVMAAVAAHNVNVIKQMR